jgi:hypothetical protein
MHRSIERERESGGMLVVYFQPLTPAMTDTPRPRGKRGGDESRRVNRKEALSHHYHREREREGGGGKDGNNEQVYTYKRRERGGPRGINTTLIY